jgi:hypothetical protein
MKFLIQASLPAEFTPRVKKNIRYDGWPGDKKKLLFYQYPFGVSAVADFLNNSESELLIKF